MAITVAQLDVRARADVSNAQRNIGSLNQSVEKSGSFFRTAASQAVGFATAMYGMQAVSGVINGVKDALFGFNGRMEQAEIGFTTMLGSGEKARAFLGELQQFAVRTPFRMQGLIENTQMLMGMGFAADEVIPTLTAIGDSVAALGRGDEGMQRALLAIGQIRTAGRLTGMEARQLAELGIPVWEMLSQKMGVSVQEVRRLSEEGLIPANEAIAMLTAGMEERFGGLMDANQRTFFGAMSANKDAIQILMGGALKPLFNLISAGAYTVSQFLQSADVQQWGKDTAAGLQSAIDGVRDFLGFGNRGGLMSIPGEIAHIARGGKVFEDMFVGANEPMRHFINSFTQAAGIQKQFDGFVGTMIDLQNPIMALGFMWGQAWQAGNETLEYAQTLLQNIGAHISSAFELSGLSSTFADIRAQVDGLFSGLGGAGSGAGVGLAQAFIGIQPAIQAAMYNATTTINAALPGLFGGLNTAAHTAVAEVSRNLGQIIPSVQRIGSEVWAAFGETAAELGPILEGIFGSALEIVGGLIGEYVGYIRDQWDSIGGVFESVASTIGQVLPSIQQIFVDVFTIIGNILRDWGPLVVDIFGAALGVISGAISSVAVIISWMVENVWPVFAEAMAAVTGWIVANWPTISSIGEQVFGAVATVLTLVGDIFRELGPIIVGVMEVVFPILVELGRVLMPMIGFAASVLFTALDLAFKGIGGAFEVLGSVFQWTYNNIIAPLWQTFGGLITGVWNNILSPLFGFIGEAFEAVGTGFGWVYDNLIKPAFASLTGGIETARDIIETVTGTISGFFEGIGTVVETVFGGIGGIIRGAINGVIDIINGAIGAINSIQVHIDVGPVQIDWDGLQLGLLPHFARGVRGFMGGWAMVGERGPELAYLPRGADVYSNRESRNMLTRTGGSQTSIDRSRTITVNVNGRDDDTDPLERRIFREYRRAELLVG